MMTLYGSRIAMVPLGPRLIFEREVPAECIANPDFGRLCMALTLEAPETVDGVVVVTSTWRPEARRFSWHQRFAALDWRTGLYRMADGDMGLRTLTGSILADDPSEALSIGRAWRERMAARLGDTFDVLLGDEDHIDHGHAEHDGSKAARVYGR